jgi:hypothetical protein
MRPDDQALRRFLVTRAPSLLTGRLAARAASIAANIESITARASGVSAPRDAARSEAPTTMASTPSTAAIEPAFATPAADSIIRLTNARSFNAANPRTPPRERLPTGGNRAAADGIISLVCRTVFTRPRPKPKVSELSFDHLVGSGEQRGWHGEAEHSGGLGIDDQLELGCLHHRQVRRARLSSMSCCPRTHAVRSTAFHKNGRKR